jgi:hypothetical protein
VEAWAVSTQREAAGRVTPSTGPSGAGEGAEALFARVDTGFATAFLPTRLPFDSLTAVYIVTDAVPPDINELVETLVAEPQTGADTRWHLVVLAEHDRTSPADAGARRSTHPGPGQRSTVPALAVLPTLTVLPTPLSRAGTTEIDNERLTEVVEWALNWAAVQK